MTNEEILNEMKKNYRQECERAGYPQDHIVNESLSNAIDKLEYALGLKGDLMI